MEDKSRTTVEQTIEYYNKNAESFLQSTIGVDMSSLKWSFESQLTKFIKRFVANPYKTEEKEWFEQWAAENDLKAVLKFRVLRDALK